MFARMARLSPEQARASAVLIAFKLFADNIQVNCREDKCDNRLAYFRQVQIRSADEPMTTFYKVHYNIFFNSSTAP